MQPSLSSSPVVVNLHPVINVHSGDLVSAMIGGGIVLVGVFLTEAFVRIRERRRRLEEATWDLLGATYGAPHEQMSGDAFLHRIARVRTNAKRPLRNAHEIVAETDRVLLRWTTATAKAWAKQSPLDLSEILGNRLVGLVFPQEPISRERMDESLKAEGLPSLAEIKKQERIDEESAS